MVFTPPSLAAQDIAKNDPQTYVRIMSAAEVRGNQPFGMIRIVRDGYLLGILKTRQKGVCNFSRLQSPDGIYKVTARHCVQAGTDINDPEPDIVIRKTLTDEKTSIMSGWNPRPLLPSKETVDTIVGKRIWINGCIPQMDNVKTIGKTAKCVIIT